MRTIVGAVYYDRASFVDTIEMAKLLLLRTALVTVWGLRTLEYTYKQSSKLPRISLIPLLEFEIRRKDPILASSRLLRIELRQTLHLLRLVALTIIKVSAQKVVELLQAERLVRRGQAGNDLGMSLAACARVQKETHFAS